MIMDDRMMMEMCNGVAAQLSAVKPRFAANAILNVLGNVLHFINDENWTQIVTASETPCGDEGCKCEVITSLVIQALNCLREENKKIMAGLEAKAGE